ncbi:MAG: cupin domain-containing protein [Perlucidibaca sp.]
MTEQILSVPLALVAREVPARVQASILPPPFAAQFEGRQRRRLGEAFGLTNFGVNLTRIAPGGRSALLHAHTRQDEFVYIVEGCPTLVTSEGRAALSPGMCAGFRAGSGRAHYLLNETTEAVWYLEVGDRTPEDEACYPEDDLRARFVDGAWAFTRRDGGAL